MQSFNDQLLRFLSASPTPFHATAVMADTLRKEGFEPLNEREGWQLRPGGRYWVTRNDSALIAFTLPEGGASLQAMLGFQGFRMLGAHTDSPCLKLKPQPDQSNKGYRQLGVEVYGGALLAPWFDRDLSLAGRVTYLDASEQLKDALVDFIDPVAVVPSLAIHLDREQNTARTINPQKEMALLLGSMPVEADDFRQRLVQLLQTDGQDVKRVLDFEICAYDVQPAAIIGMQREFIASARLDNLLSCFIGLKSLLASTSGGAMLICNDHEEVGSASTSGAAGPFLETVLERIMPATEPRAQMLANSLLISADNAHGVHPNFADKHDAQHGPLLNAGPVIKVNANQRYASNSRSSSLFKHLAEQEGVPVQVFSVRADMACGSTIGPLTATRLGIETLDIGVPTFAMHSIRELAGVEDSYSLHRVVTRFMNRC